MKLGTERIADPAANALATGRLRAESFRWKEGDTLKLAEIEQNATNSLAQREAAVQLDRNVSKQFLIAKLLQTLDAEPKIEEISIECQAESDDEGGSYIYVSWYVGLGDDAEEEYDVDDFAYNRGFDGVENEVVQDLFGGWEGTLTRRQIQELAKAYGIQL